MPEARGVAQACVVTAACELQQCLNDRLAAASASRGMAISVQSGLAEALELCGYLFAGVFLEEV